VIYLNCIVTGASSGIGMELSRLLCREKGNRVIGVARNEERLKALREELGECFTFVVADLSTVDGIEKTVKSVYSVFSNVDVLVNNAGFGLYKNVLSHSDEEIISMTMTNFVSPILLTKKLLPLMHKDSVVAMVITAGVHVLMKNLPIYGATKSALNYVAEALRDELREYGVHLLLVYPGLIKTEFHLRAGKNIESGLDAEKAAKAIINGIRKRRKRVYIPSYLTLARILGPHLIPFD